MTRQRPPHPARSGKGTAGTPAHTHSARTVRRGRNVTHRWSGALTRVSAAAALTLVVTGPPALLLALTGNPTRVPGGLRSLGALRHPTDDRTLLWILATVAWLAWLRLLTCLVLETLEQARGATVRLPLPGLLFGADRVLAAHLIAALLMTTHPTDAAYLTPARAPAGVVTALSQAAPHALGRNPVPEASMGSALGAPVRGQSTTPRSIECRVLPPRGRHHDTLWDIAARHLGDGIRWREIFALNDGRVMPDGQRLTHASLIRPGWTLLLPADATILPVDHVLLDHLDEARPGPAPAPRVASPTQDPAPRDRVGAAPGGAREDPSLRRPDARGNDAGHGSAPAPPGAVAPPSPARSAPTTPRSEDAPPRAGERDSVPAIEVATLGSLLLAASALLAALTRRRKRAARRRPPGVRAARPAPDVLDTERRLRRQAQRADDVGATIRLALLVAAQAEPPVRVKAVWEHPDATLELVLTDHRPDVPAPTPFTTTPRGWQLAPDGQRYLFAVRSNGHRRQDRPARLDDLLQAAADPFPVLLPVGAQDGSACLVNLELLGLISLDTHPVAADGSTDDPADDDAGRGDVEAVLAAWAQALAGAPWAELTHLYLPTGWEDVATGLRDVSTVALLCPNGAAAPRPPQPLLGTDGADGSSGDSSDAVTVTTLEAARRTGLCGADSIPINVIIGYRAEQVPGWLLAAATDPSDPNVVLLAGPHPDAHQWHLSPAGTLAIPGIADRLVPLRLDPDEHQLRLRLLEHAEDPPHAAPDDPHRATLLTQCPPLPAPATATADAPSAHAAASGTGTYLIDLTTPATQQPPESAPAELDAPDPRRSGPPARTHTDRTGAPSLTGDREGTVSGLAPGQGTNEERDATSAPARTTPPAVDLADGAGDNESTATRPPAGEPSRDAAEPLALPPGPVEVCVLGPLEVHGAAADLPRKQALDMLVYLAMHRRPVPPDVLFEAVWPSNGFNGRTLRNRVSEIRAYVAPGIDYTRGGYQLPDLVQTDWQRFQTLARGDAAAQMAALTLVRGRPFEGMTLDWVHLEGHFAELEAAIVDLALQVGDRALRSQDFAGARKAVYAGLRGCPYEERLYRVGMESAAARGATAELRELRRRLDLVLADEVDDDVQPTTRELYQRLQNEDELRRRRQGRRG
jgi:DNA-binding SARP family transcriptional activator